jgi:DNA-binding NarL/FixJ family response regulator
LIADDSEVFRKAVKNLLNNDSGNWVVCGEATNVEDAVREVGRRLPDVVLLDLSIPLLHGLRVGQILKRDYPGVIVILMSEQDGSVLARVADAAGTEYHVSKSRAALDLIPMLLSLVHASKKTIPPQSEKSGSRDPLAVGCPTCGAPPGVRCELSTGALRKTPHRDRRLVAKDKT